MCSVCLELGRNFISFDVVVIGERRGGRDGAEGENLRIIRAFGGKIESRGTGSRAADDNNFFGLGKKRRWGGSGGGDTVTR